MFHIEKTKLSDFRYFTKEQPSCYVSIPVHHVYYSSISKISVNGEINICGYVSDDRKFVYGIHKEKHRKKAKQTSNKGKQKHKLTKEAYWKMTIYKFPVERVKKFKQYARHFDVVLF